MRKQQSTNFINEQFLLGVCELNSALSIISGRWKTQIVYSISEGDNRFNLLKKQLPNISDQVLGRQLKELEKHAILVKKDMPDTVPSGVEYVLTQKGLEVVPILRSLCEWGKKYAGEEITIPCNL